MRRVVAPAASFFPPGSAIAATGVRNPALRPTVGVLAATLACALPGCTARGLSPAPVSSEIPPPVLTTPDATGDWSWNLPPGFPPPRVPADNPMTAPKVALGEALFFDRRLSFDGSTACADCHDPARAFTDGRARSVGADGRESRRGAMPLANAAYLPALEWASPGVRSLEAQAIRPLLNDDPVEMGFGLDAAARLRELRADPATRTRFEAAFPDAERPVTTTHVRLALAAYQRTLFSGRSAYDRYVYEDDRDALSPAARRGMDLFFSERAGCAKCHGGLLFSGAFDAVGLPPAEPAFRRNGLPVDPADRGLAEVTGDPADAGRFRVPSLRDVARTAPYMHDGRFATLDAVLDHYATADDAASGLRPATLSEDERRDVIAFLEALTGEPRDQSRNR